MPRGRSRRATPTPTGNERLAYVDPALNAVVAIDGTTVRAYRYKVA